MSKFYAKEKIDRFLFSLFNNLSDFYFFTRFDTRAILKKNQRFKNLYAGQRCFILGTGPSINALSGFQIQTLKDEKTFAVNSIYKVPKLTPITPSFYALLDNNYWGVASYTFQEILSKYKESPPTFITDIRARPMLPKGIDCIYVHAKNYPIRRMRFDIAKNMSIAMNVVSFSILCAVYMGFKEIFLLGCDYNLFCSRVGTHCYDDEAEIEELPKYNLAFYLKYYHLTTQFHYLIADLANELNLKIINLTQGSLLDAYPHKNVNAILSESVRSNNC